MLLPLTANRVPKLVAAMACMLLTLTLKGGSAESAQPKAAARGVFVVQAGTAKGRLRVAAEPGDLGLRNSTVTAVVRKADGWLVDFWPMRPTKPTTPQLGNVSNADGIWQLAPIIHDGRHAVPVSYDSVQARRDTIVASTTVKVAGTQIRLETEYKLNAEEPEVIATTRVSHAGGGHAHIKMQEGLKWGNTDYFVEGNHAPLNRFNGRARWVGRHGLCGDLKWIRLDEDPFQLEFQQSHPGLAPQLVGTYGLWVVKPQAQYTFSRKLRYEPIVHLSVPEAPKGVLRAAIVDEAGRALPAKLSFKGLGKTPTPDFGNDGDEYGVNRFAFSGTGRFVRPLPVGHYQVLATAGPERAAESWRVRIEANKKTDISGKLPRLIETPGWLSADLHLHQVESVDADVAHSSRLIAVAAEGVELAAATDHYAVTDFAPTVARLVATGQLATPLATMVASEISTVGNRFGHFNLLPMDVDDHIDFSDTTPKKMIAEMRQVAPDSIIQVNHPRWTGIGYFQVHSMDPKTHRIPYRFKDEYEPDFDAIEVFNGLDAYSHQRVRLVLRDWIALLGQGHRYTATGNSDSHKLAFHDPGLPRNLIRHGLDTSDAQDPRVPESAVIEGIKQGRVLVTNGPFIDVNVGDQGPGDVVKSGGKPVVLNIRVRAVPWVDVSRVEVLVGAKAGRLRYVTVPASKELVRYEEAVKVPGYAKTFVIVLAAGKKLLQNVHATGVQPLAFTNPIWIEP